MIRLSAVWNINKLAVKIASRQGQVGLSLGHLGLLPWCTFGNISWLFWLGNPSASLQAYRSEVGFLVGRLDR